jgi:exosome complex component RRP41
MSTSVDDEEILEVLRTSDDPELTTTEVAERLPITRGTTRSRLQSLVDEGHLERRSEGNDVVWWLPERAGEAAAAADEAEEAEAEVEEGDEEAEEEAEEAEADEEAEEAEEAEADDEADEDEEVETEEEADEGRAEAGAPDVEAEEGEADAEGEESPATIEVETPRSPPEPPEPPEQPEGASVGAEPDEATGRPAQPDLDDGGRGVPRQLLVAAGAVVALVVIRRLWRALRG